MTGWGGTVLGAALVVLLGVVAYGNTFDGEWVWDDASSVLLHEHVQDPTKVFQLFREDQHAFGRGAGNFYRPLLSVSFMLDAMLSHVPSDASGAAAAGLSPFVFHLTSLCWHLAAAVLLLFVLARLGAPPVVRLATAAIFVVHPLHTEAVSYISGRADMMSATFLFAALLCALAPAAGSRKIFTVALAVLFFVCGLLSKESSLIFPLLLGVALLFLPREEFSPERSRFLRLVKSPAFLASLVVLGIYIALRATVLQFATAANGTSSPLGARLIEVGQAFAFYLRVLFWPTGLHMEQSLVGVPVWTTALGWGALFCMIAACAWAVRRNQPRIAMGLAWFLATWLPISGLFPLNAPMAEHWMYVPMAGFWWAVLESVRLAAGARSRTLIPVTVSAFVLLLTIFTVQRNDDWHSNQKLFRATLAESPGSLRVQYNLAVAYEDLLHNSAGAARHYQNVLDLIQKQKASAGATGMLEDEIEVRLSLGKALFTQERFGEAAGQFAALSSLQDTKRFAPVIAQASLGLGKSFLALGEFGQAQAAFGRAVAADASLLSTVTGLL